jgi:glycogen operon protein
MPRKCHGQNINPAGNFGQSAPLGSAVCYGGVNFSLYSREASGVELLLFDREDDVRPARAVNIDPAMNRTHHYWHVFVPGVQSGQIYGYRVHGPFDPGNGLRFDCNKVLLDPYGRGMVIPRNYSRDAACKSGENTAAAMKSVVVYPATYDRQLDTPLNPPSSRTIVYGMHVRGLYASSQFRHV